MSFNYKISAYSQVADKNTLNTGNFFFDNKALKAQNAGISQPLCSTFNSDSEQCAGVFDGAGSGVGSHTVINCLRYFQKQKDKQDLDYIFQLQDFFKATDKIVCGLEKSKDKNVSSVLAYIKYNGIYLQSCGRVTAYLLRKGKLVRLNPDDITARELGGIGEFNPQPVFGEIKSDDRIVLSSHSVKNVLSDIEFNNILNKYEDGAQCVQALCESAVATSNCQNATCIVIDIFDETSEGYWVLPDLCPSKPVVNEVTGEFEIDPAAKTMEIISGSAIGSFTEEELVEEEIEQALNDIQNEEEIYTDSQYYEGSADYIPESDYQPQKNIFSNDKPVETHPANKKENNNRKQSNILVYLLLAIVSVIAGLTLTILIKTLCKPASDVEISGYIVQTQADEQTEAADIDIPTTNE